MASPSLPVPPDDPANSGSVTADEGFAVVFGEWDPKAIRRAHLREESYLKAVGWINYFYALFLSAPDIYFLRLTFLHLSGRINAAWSVRPGWVAYQVVGCLMAVLALIAGYGFCRIKPWALRVEAIFVLCFLLEWPLSILAHSRPPGALEFTGRVLLMTACLVPLINLWDVRKSPVFTAEYRRVIAATPGRARARLSWELMLVMVVLFVLATTILVFTVEH